MKRNMLVFIMLASGVFFVLQTYCKNLDALLKMPGVDAKKIQEQSGKIVFDAKAP